MIYPIYHNNAPVGFVRFAFSGKHGIMNGIFMQADFFFR